MVMAALTLFRRVVDRVERPELVLRIVLSATPWLSPAVSVVLAVINVTDRTHVHMRLAAIKTFPSP